MKRIYISLILLIVSTLIGAFEIGFINAKSDSFISKIEATDKLMHKNNFEDAVKHCKETEKQWEDIAEIIDMVLIHDYVDEIGDSISKMRSYAENRSVDMYFAESTATKKGLALIKENEYPNLNNIL